MNTDLNLKINDNFTIRADQYQYILVESYMGKPGMKDGKVTPAKLQEKHSYYPSLEQCIAAVRDADVKASGDTLKGLSML